MLQGTYLPAAVAEDLHDFQQHTQLRDAMQRLRELYGQLSAVRRRLTSHASVRVPR